MYFDVLCLKARDKRCGPKQSWLEVISKEDPAIERCAIQILAR